MKVDKKLNILITNGETIDLNDIEVITIKNKYYIAIYKKDGELLCSSQNVEKEFRQLAILMQNEQINNFIWMSGNMLINSNTVKKVSYNATQMTVYSENYQFLINKVCGAEALYLLEQCQKNKQNQMDLTK